MTVEEVKRLYWFEELSMRKIAERWGCTQSNVWQFMRRHNIPRREPFRHPRRSIMCRLCPKTVCRFKDHRIKTGSQWKKATLCMDHFIERARKQRADAAIRFRGGSKQPRRGPQKKRPMQLNWVKEW